MGARKDKKEKSKKGRDKVKGWKVNPPEEIPAEHSNGEEIQEGDQGKSQETTPRETPVDMHSQKKRLMKRWMKNFHHVRGGRRLLN